MTVPSYRQTFIEVFLEHVMVGATQLSVFSLPKEKKST